MAKNTDTLSEKPSKERDSLAIEIGRRIVEARDGLGLSQQAIHTRTKMADPEGAGISRAVLSLYETGVNKPGAREIRLLCDVLKVSPNWLLYGANGEPASTHPTSEFMLGGDLELATRIAHALLLLPKESKETLAAIIFKMAQEKAGDLELSSVMAFTNLFILPVLRKEIAEHEQQAGNYPDEPSLYLDIAKGSLYTNYGNLRPAKVGDEVDSDNPPPPRQLSGKKQ